MLGAGSRCGSDPTAGSRLRGSASENRHGGAPREVPVAPGQGGRASQARPKERVRLSALHPPLIGGCGSPSSRRRKAAGSLARRSVAKAGDRQSLAKRVRQEASKTRVQQRAAGTKNTALFDIVSYDYGQRFALRAAISRVGAPPLVSRASERQRAKTRYLGATQQNRATVETSRRVSPRSRVSLRSPGTRDRSTGPRGTLSVADRPGRAARLEQKPGPLFGLVDPVLEQACAGHVVAFVAEVMGLAHEGDQLLVVLA